MLPFKANFATGVPLLASSLFVLLFLTSSGVRGAALREHRLRGSESDTQTENAFQAPNADMLKALEYIENLRQKTTTESQQRASSSAGMNGSRMDDAETLRTMLRLASQPFQSKDKNKEEANEEEEEEGEDRSEELLQAVLSTLQQTEKSASPRAGQKDGAHPRVQERHRGITPHRKLPLMFEDEEEEEESKRDEGRAGGEEQQEEEEAVEEEDLGRESPFKRTNENVEEKYTPQNLATLQSVFDELDKLTGMKSVHERRAEQKDREEQEEEEEEGEEGRGNSFDARNTAYEDEEEEPGEEEERADKGEDSRALDYNEEEEGEAPEEEEKDLLRRADDEPDDVANMVDYYLLKVLETTEEQQKRELEEEEEEEKEEEEENQRAERALYRDSVDPRTIYQLIKISQKYQIPPEDLLDMLKSGETSRPGLKPQRVSKMSRTQTGSRLSHLFPKKTYMSPETRFYTSRLLPVRPKTPEERRTEEILKILGLSASDERLPVRKLRPYQSSISRLRTPPAWARPGEPSPVQPRRLPKYDQDGSEDELAAYLAAQMLAKYPKPALGGGKAANQKRDRGEQSMTDSLEQAVQDYFQQMDSDKSRRETRRPGGDGGDDTTAGFDSEAMMKLLSLLNPESEDGDANGM